MKNIEKTIKMIGIVLIIFALLANPFVIEQLFSYDKNLENLTKLRIIVLDIFIFIFGLFTYFISKKIKKESILKISISFLTIIIMIILIDSTSFLIISVSEKYNKNTEITNNNNKNNTPNMADDSLGFRLKENYSYNALKVFPNGTIIFNATQTTDRYGRRIINQKYKQNNSHLILFGCSNTFGSGLNDNETLAYDLAKELPEYNIYNYAVSGYGPQQMLAILEKGNLPNEVMSSNENIAIYIFIGDHFNRAIGSTRADWTIKSNSSFPYYHLDKKGILHRDGSFETGRPITTKIYQNFLKFKEKSVFLKFFDINLPLTESKKDVQLTYKIIAESKRLYEQQFNGTFYVVIHPLSIHSEQENYLIDLLKKNNITVLYYSIDNKNGEYEIAGDVHPNARLNEILAPMIANDLNKMEEIRKNDTQYLLQS
jgi:hypothetical protein